VLPAPGLDALEDASHGVAPSESFEAQDAWKQQPEFREQIMRVRSHCDDFEPAVLEVVTQVA